MQLASDRTVHLRKAARRKPEPPPAARAACGRPQALNPALAARGPGASAGSCRDMHIARAHQVAPAFQAAQRPP